MLKTHGLGGSTDLPIPASFAITGGAAALVLSFAILLLAWRRPRYIDPDAGRRAPARLASAVDRRPFRVLLRLIGLVFFGFTLMAAVLGKDELGNPIFGIVYAWLWVGIVPVSLLFGSFFEAISPARTFHLVLSRLTGSDPEVGTWSYPAWLGYWPAAAGIFAFVWLELVYPNSIFVGPVRLWFAIYIGAMLLGSAVFGQKWFERADPFEVYSTLVGRLSVWGRDRDGRLLIRSPLRNLASMEPASGLVAVVAVLLGSTAYDSFRGINAWLQYTQSYSGSLALLGTGVLLVACLIVGLSLAGATVMTGTSEHAVPRRRLPAEFAPSIVPIIVGYMVAHYISFLVEYGQETLKQVSDPLGNGADWFGTADLQVNYWLSANPTALASIKVVAIVTGHLLGVIAAHDKALQLLPKQHHITGQLPLLCAMVLYTYGGLYLLFGV